MTVRRAILDGIEAGLGGHLIDQALETTRRRGLLSRSELDASRAGTPRLWSGPRGIGRHAAHRAF